MKIIGLTGGIASGKSAVAMELVSLGTAVLDADQAAHQIINLPAVQQALQKRWGPGVLKPSGEIDRTVVAQRVFSGQQKNSPELQFLEETLHPRIRAQFEAQIAKLAAAGTAVAVVDAPLLLEAGWRNLCDSVVFVDCPREKRLERAKLRNWSADQFAAREAAQMPIEEKKQEATYTLVNDGSRAKLSSQVQALWKVLNP